LPSRAKSCDDEEDPTPSFGNAPLIASTKNVGFAAQWCKAGSQEEGAMLVDSILFSAAMIGVLLFVGVLLWVDFRPR
jgi:hypothetical protein